MISVVLVEPRNSGNLGAIARVMKNFGFSDLIVVNPRCNPNSIEARKRSKHALDVLKKVKVIGSLDELKHDKIVATTSVLGTDYNILRAPLAPDKLRISGKTALVFGREGSGLRNEELRKCDVVVSIPTSRKYRAMNLSHAVAVMLYELSDCRIEGFREGTRKEKDALMNYISGVLDKLDFTTREKRETQKMLWKKIIGKSNLTKRELYALFGFFRKI